MKSDGKLIKAYSSSSFTFMPKFWGEKKVRFKKSVKLYLSVFEGYNLYTEVLVKKNVFVAYPTTSDLKSFYYIGKLKYYYPDWFDYLGQL